MSETPRHMKSAAIRADWKTVLAAVQNGEEIVVEQYNQPVARIIPYKEPNMKEIALPDRYSRPTILQGWYDQIYTLGESDPETGEPSPGLERLAEALTNAYRDAINARMPEGVEVQFYAESRILYDGDLYPELGDFEDVEDEFDFETETMAAAQDVHDRFEEIEAAAK